MADFSMKKQRRTVVDIERPGQADSYFVKGDNKKRTVNLNIPMEKEPVKRPLSSLIGKRAILVSILIVFLASGVIFVRGFFDARNTISEKGKEVMENFIISFEMAEEMNFEEMNQHLKKNVGILGLVSGSSFLDAAGKIIPTVRDVTNAIRETTNLSLEMIMLSEIAEELKNSGFHYFLEDGEKFISLLREVEEVSGSVMERFQNIKNISARLKNISPGLERFDSLVSDYYFASTADFYQANRLLSNLIGLLDSNESNIIVLFQNPSEMRPAGGFSGTYAHLKIARGQVQEINVEDIYRPDFHLEEKYIPPEPLQGITPDWGARDAAWFFDFPTSAKITLEMLEKSNMYAEEGIEFDGLIALNINVLSSILEIIGPVELNLSDIALNEEEGEVIEINADNVLFELRSEIEASRERKEGQPKRIISALTPVILEDLSEMNEEQKAELIRRIGEHIGFNDIMFFARDSGIASFLSERRLDGGMDRLSGSFWGNYLAVVNANVAGGKSDVFVEQMLKANIHLDTDGSILTDLTIIRKHTGDQEKDPWWRATNRNYMQIFTNPRASLVSISGQAFPEETGLRKIVSEYGEDYIRHPELAKIEGTTLYNSNNGVWTKNYFGRNIFAFWFNVSAGETGVLDLRYQIPAGIIRAAPDREYRFILDRQPGVNSHLDLTVFAPVGYVWKESGTSIYTYEGTDLSKRFELILTLEERIR